MLGEIASEKKVPESSWTNALGEEFCHLYAEFWYWKEDKNITLSNLKWYENSIIRDAIPPQPRHEDKGKQERGTV